MSCRDDLIALHDAVLAGDFVKFRIIAKVLASESRDIGKTWPSHDAQKAMSGSVDAALAFFAAVLPGWDWGRQPSILEIYVFNASGDAALARRTKFDGINETPARALLLATLNALIADADT